MTHTYSVASEPLDRGWIARLYVNGELADKVRARTRERATNKGLDFPRTE